jgi:hypothetical protein
MAKAKTNPKAKASNGKPRPKAKVEVIEEMPDGARILPMPTKPLRRPAGAGANGKQQTKAKQQEVERNKRQAKNESRRKTQVEQGVSEWPEDTVEKGPAKDKKKAEQAKKEDKKARTKAEKRADYNRNYGQKWNEVLYEDIELMLYRKFPKGVDESNAEEHGENGPLDMAAAAELLGWTEEMDGVKFGGDYKFKDLNGNKIRLLKNPTNRPFRRNLALRYANEILRGEWQLNGESIIIDKYGRVQSGQHRLAGVIFANQMLNEDLEKWSDYGWKDGVYIEVVVVVGVDPSPKVVDTIDIGQKRSLGDVIFRNDEFKGTEREMAKSSNVLSHAVRLVWLRAGGKKVSDAPHFPHSEALNFFKEHPRLKECVQFINDAEGGGGEDGKRISSCLSLGYASGLMYLMATSKTDRDAFDAGEEELDFSNWEKAQDFWTHFAKDFKSLPVGHAIKECRKRLSEISAGDGKGRDEIVGTVAKCFNAWMDGKKITTAKLKRKETEDEVIIQEDPRIGGLDTAIE